MLRLMCVMSIAAVLLPAPAMAAETWDNVKTYTVEKKDEAVTYGKKLVREADQQIDGLEKGAAKASNEVKAQYQKEMKELRAKRAQAATKLDQMGKASAAAWDEAKNGFADAYKDLHQAYDRAAAKLK